MFFGREELMDELAGLFRKRTASLVTCRGRRRIGKSTLIERFAAREGCRFLKIEGRHPSPGLGNGDELEAFAKQLAAQTEAERGAPANWLDAFRRLDGQLGGQRKTVVLLDEVSWLGQYDGSFADDLKVAWDNWFKKHDRLVMVLCGSVSSWIRENVIDNTAFMGRRSLDMVVPELGLEDCAKFWGRAAERVGTREILDVLSVTGGVPRYLEEIDPGAGAMENIRRLCFRPNAVLRTDFDEMFRDTVGKEREFSAKVLRRLAEGAASAAEVAKSLGEAKGGRVSGALSRLGEAGFAALDDAADPETGRTPRERRWRLRDNYARFYLKYIEPAKTAIDECSFADTPLEALPGIEGVMGLAFENLVVNHARELLPLLGMRGVLATSVSPWRRRGTSGRKGVQIDLLARGRRVACVVEVKRRRELGREIIDEVDEKVRAVKWPAGTAVRTALVYEGRLSPGVEADGYFDAVVPFGRLLGS